VSTAGGAKTRDAKRSHAKQVSWVAATVPLGQLVGPQARMVCGRWARKYIAQRKFINRKSHYDALVAPAPILPGLYQTR
jgi:hypothetical protein